MKRILALILCLLVFFGCSQTVFANGIPEDASQEPPTSHPGAPDLSATARPQYSYINNISVTFYVTNGRAYASYSVISCVNGITVDVQIEKRTLGFLWIDVGNEKKEKSDKKYLSGSYSVPVDGSGIYRVVVKVQVSDEGETKTVVYDYDENILMGDANSDGYVRANDARLILRFSAKLQNYSSNQARICDIDKNGYITAADARIALRMSARL